MRVLIIDNYDSFTYNLYQYVGEILSCESLSRQNPQNNFDILVKRNDELSLGQIRKLSPHRIIISPGPGSPEDPSYFGVCQSVIRELGKTIPLLGVCLGMQGIAHTFGAKVVLASEPMHGKTSMISHDALGVYQSMPQGLEVMRYHSLMIDPESLPQCLSITSIVTPCNDDDELDFQQAAKRGWEIMGLRHQAYPIEGIQFHPESFATEGGRALLENFLLQTFPL